MAACMEMEAEVAGAWVVRGHRCLCPHSNPGCLTGITVPQEHGGLGLGYLHHCVAMEELSRASGWLETGFARPKRIGWTTGPQQIWSLHLRPTFVSLI